MRHNSQRPSTDALTCCPHPSTVHKIVSRYRVARLSWLDLGTGRATRSHELTRPGDLVRWASRNSAGSPMAGTCQRLVERGHSKDRLRLHSPGHRRSVQAGAFGDPHGRTRGKRRRLLAPGQLLVSGQRHHRPTSTDDIGSCYRSRSSTQPLGLESNKVHPASAPDGRQGRRVQPHDGGGMGLRQAVLR